MIARPSLGRRVLAAALAAVVVPAAADNVLYGMGLGRHGGYVGKMFAAPGDNVVDWKWDGVRMGWVAGGGRGVVGCG